MVQRVKTTITYICRLLLVQKNLGKNKLKSIP
jgi:hypothetical protein